MRFHLKTMFGKMPNFASQNTIKKRTSCSKYLEQILRLIFVFKTWEKRSEETESLGSLRWAVPFVLLTVILIIIRLGPKVEWALLGGDGETGQDIFNPELLKVRYEEQKWERRFGWLAHSGKKQFVNFDFKLSNFEFESKTSFFFFLERILPILCSLKSIFSTPIVM